MLWLCPYKHQRQAGFTCNHRTLPSPLTPCHFPSAVSWDDGSPCTALLRKAGNVSLHKPRRMALIRVFAQPRGQQGGTHGKSQRCPMYHAGCRTALPRDGPVLLGNWNSEDWQQVSSPCAILYFHIPALLFALPVKQCHSIFHGLAAKAVEAFLSCLFFPLSKTFFIQFIGEADKEQHKHNLVLTALKSKTWIYT